MVTEKAAHDRVIRRYSGTGKRSPHAPWSASSFAIYGGIAAS
jgi:hypothetical protein